MKSSEKISLYKESLKSAWGYNDYNDWPIKFNSIMHLFLNEFSKEFLNDICDLEAIGCSKDIISKSFGNPARIYRIIHSLVYGMKGERINIVEQRRIVIYLLELVEILKSGSIYNENGKNIILNTNDLNTIVKNVKFSKADTISSALLHKFFGLMWAYTEAIFFRAHDVTKEIHGMYDLKDTKEKLLIREYMHLSPKNIWKDITLLNIDKLEFYTIYNDNLSVTLDAYNHLFFNSGDYNNDLLEYAIICDQKQISLDELEPLMNTMIKTITEIHSWTDNVSDYEKICRYADIYWYRKKPLCDLLGKDWMVPTNVMDNIKKGKKDIRWEKNLNDDKIDWLIKLLI